jgi:hypothetical protein
VVSAEDARAVPLRGRCGRCGRCLGPSYSPCCPPSGRWSGGGWLMCWDVGDARGVAMRGVGVLGYSRASRPALCSRSRTFPCDTTTESGLS